MSRHCTPKSHTKPVVPVENGQAESNTTQPPSYSNHMKQNKTSTQRYCRWRAVAESQTTQRLSIPSISDQILTQMLGYPTKMGCAGLQKPPSPWSIPGTPAETRQQSRCTPLRRSWRVKNAPCHWSSSGAPAKRDTVSCAPLQKGPVR